MWPHDDAMATSTRATPGRDLRQEILDTARALLNDVGASGLSMREVARRAGVTHQAPYHHFGDRESILAELVAEGFRTLGRNLAQANTLAAHNLRGAVMASGRAYIDFALSNPGVFRVMFRPETCDPARFPAVQAAGQAAQATLVELVSMVHGTQTSPALCMVYWAHVHGMASLLLDGSLGQECPAGPMRDTLLDEVSNTFANLVFGSAQQPLGELTPPGNR
jgi:AcrR family transcriptional regulator